MKARFELIVIGALLWGALFMLSQVQAQPDSIFATGFESRVWVCDPIRYWPSTQVMIARDCFLTETPEDFEP